MPISQPLVSLLLSQSAKPVLQTPLHAPIAQVGLAMLLFEHTRPQLPQLVGSPATLVSQPLLCLLLSQSAKPALQAPLHAPIAQVGAAMFSFEQTVPQVPQLAGSVFRLTSQPSVSLLPLQSA